jgi:uncharacterized repeat protein (TIGR03803 family)
LLADGGGHLYGTTYGYVSDLTSSLSTIYRLTPPAAGNGWTETTLATMQTGLGLTILAPLVADTSGLLYGITVRGGVKNQGTVFRVKGTGFIH